MARPITTQEVLHYIQRWFSNHAVQGSPESDAQNALGELLDHARKTGSSSWWIPTDEEGDDAMIVFTWYKGVRTMLHFRNTDAAYSYAAAVRRRYDNLDYVLPPIEEED